jgi:hypothetical protein
VRGLSLSIALAAGGCSIVFEAIPENRSPCAGQEGLVLCLDFEDPLDDGLATDRSPSAADAAVGPNATTVERGLDNHAVHLDAGDPIEVPVSPALDGLTAFTFELTVKLDVMVNAMFVPTLLEHSGSWAIAIIGDGHAVCVLPDNGVIGSDERLDDGALHRITCVKSDRLSMFVDGNAQNASTMATLVAPTARPTLIGNNSASTGPLVGVVDSVRIWSRPLSSFEVAESAEIPFETSP